MADNIVAEEWRPVVGWEGVYSISNLGEIRRTKPSSQSRYKNIIGERMTKGYVRFNLVDVTRQERVMAHRVVLSAFVGPCPTGHECNHKNGKRDDNRLENLEWVTPSNNTRHAWNSLPNKRKNQPRGEKSPNARFFERDVREIRRRCDSGESVRGVARSLGASRCAVGNIAKRISWRHIM